MIVFEFLSSLFTLPFGIFIALFVLLGINMFLSIKRKQRYFENLGIPYNKPVFLLGNGWKTLVGKENMNAFVTRMYNEGAGHKLVGVFQGTAPVIIVRDPELANIVLVKEFSNYHDRGMVIDEELNPLEGHLFNLPGLKWKILRNKLSPTFTSGKIKGMFPLMEQCVDVFIQDIDNHLDQEMDLKAEFLKVAAYIIGSCTFGIEMDSIRNGNDDFTKLGIKLIQPDFKEMALTIIRFLFPSLAKKFKFRTVSKEVNDFFFGLVKDSMDHRKNTGYSRNDFLQLLLELREKGDIQVEKGFDLPDNQANDLHAETTETIELTDNVLTAQAAVFLAAGFETTSTSLTFICYELSKNPKVQEKLRNELKDAKNKFGGFTYLALTKMDYLDAVINESLRLWPPVGGLIRVCSKTTNLGGFTVEKGVIIQIPSEAFQRDPAFFTEPDTFKPERWLEESFQNCSFLPFGGGPRVCIGERFARLELKITIAKLVDRYRIETCTKMAAAEPITFKKGTFLNVPNDGVYCVFSKLK